MLLVRSKIPNSAHQIYTKLTYGSYTGRTEKHVDFNFFRDDADSAKTELLSLLEGMSSLEISNEIENALIKIHANSDKSNNCDLTQGLYKLWLIYMYADNGSTLVTKVLLDALDTDVEWTIDSNTVGHINALLPMIHSMPKLLGKSENDKDYSFSRADRRMSYTSQHGNHAAYILNEVPLLIYDVQLTEIDFESDYVMSFDKLNAVIMLFGNIYNHLKCDEREHYRLHLRNIINNNILIGGYEVASSNIRTTKEQFIFQGSIAAYRFDECHRYYENFICSDDIGLSISNTEVITRHLKPASTSLLTWTNTEGNFKYIKVHNFTEED